MGRRDGKKERKKGATIVGVAGKSFRTSRVEVTNFTNTSLDKVGTKSQASPPSRAFRDDLRREHLGSSEKTKKCAKGTAVLPRRSECGKLGGEKNNCAELE